MINLEYLSWICELDSITSIIINKSILNGENLWSNNNQYKNLSQRIKTVIWKYICTLILMLALSTILKIYNKPKDVSMKMIG